MEKLKLFEMFAGYGGASFALKKAGIPFECVGFSEIDKFAVQCYKQNHKHTSISTGVTFANDIPYNFNNATLINPKNIPDFDLLTGGFPCQAFSVAGKGLGELDTRGTLFNEIIRIAEFKQPKYMLLENVKGLTNKRHKPTFDKILSELDRIGYDVKWKVLNSREHGIPQNRERVFFACKLKNVYGVSFWNFKFPKKEELKIFLKDILEDEVNDKYYLKQDKVNRLLPNQEVSYCIDANYHKGISIEQFIKKRRRQIIQLNKPDHSNDRVYSEDGISPTLNTMQGGDRQPFIVASRGRNIENPSDRTSGNLTEQRLEPKIDGTSNTISTVQKDNYLCIRNATKKGFIEGYPNDGVNLEQPNSKTRRGRVQKDVMGTLQTNDQRGVITEDMRIRKLTPKESFRLMGFLDDGINLDGLSNTQRYKLAGNGWDINLVSKIFKCMFGSHYDTKSFNKADKNP